MPEPKADEIVRDTVTNRNGVQLAMAFNKPKQTAAFVLQGETIDLKQERMASGIKYRNADYVYQEHQGEINLKKNGKPFLATGNKTKSVVCIRNLFSMTKHAHFKRKRKDR